MKKITIAIDGFSSTGKSTLAKQLAKALGYIYVDTGAMYRAITLFAMNKGFIGANSENSDGLVAELSKIQLRFVFNEGLGFSEMYLNDKNVEAEIRKMEVSRNVSHIAEIEQVRIKLVALQKKMGEEKGIVMDGRDIGTVVFPDAELKIFMTASAETRAKRRYKELIDRDHNLSYEAVLENITTRDHIDSTRKDSPLVKADEAIEIDNSDLTIETQLKTILALAKNSTLK